MEESSYAGISVRGIDLWVSTTSASSDFEKVASFEATKGTRKSYILNTMARARWLKLLITSNYGHSDYTEMMELEAYGTIVKKSDNPALSGSYNTNYNMLLFKQEGKSVHGCYDLASGTINGKTDGRTAKFQWSEKQGTYTGTAVLVLAADGKTLNGTW